MSLFSLENFRAEVLNRGLAKANRFEVIIVPPKCVASAGDVRLISMMAENCQLPTTRIITAQQRIFGPPTNHPQSAEYGGDNMTVQFYLDREMTVKRFFDVWVDGIVDRTRNTVYYQDNYLSQGMTISQLDEQDRAVYGVKFMDLFPIAVNPVQLDHNQANTVSRLTVTFAYRRWVDVTAVVGQAVQAPRNQQTPALRNNTPNQSNAETARLARQNAAASPSNVTYTTRNSTDSIEFRTEPTGRSGDFGQPTFNIVPTTTP